MGLAAGQARLLSITARKSDCEFQSMRLSHQKIAMARELADLSNEYQNSLTQTKLIYDYYGTGDTSTPLTYGLMMQPSALNDYMPITLTSTDGRVVLNSRLAQAAKDAGIPQEGLGTLPSEELRNRFIFGLEGTGVINSDLAGRITELPYAQGAGFGGGATVAVNYKEGNFDELVKYLNESSAIVNIEISKEDLLNGKGGALEENSPEFKLFYTNKGTTDDSQKIVSAEDGNTITSFNFGDLLSGKSQAELYIYTNKTGDKKNGPAGELIGRAQDLLSNVLDQADSYLTQVLDLGDGYSSAALDYARDEIIKLYSSENDNTSDHSSHPLKKGSTLTTWVDYPDDYKMVNMSNNYVGWISSGKHQGWFGNNRGKACININNLLNAYLTYFADFMNGLSATDSEGKEVFDAKKGLMTNSFLAKDNTEFLYKMKTGTELSSDDLGQATFYDALFNQICAHGWIENNEVNDKEYLKHLLESGKAFISRVNEDNYYYQTNYGTDNYIKEIPDETLIAYAEAKYSTEKAKLNSKEETIDLKMKNLDTEISSLTTEYDTVKNTISKNIEKSFKRFSA